MSLIVDIIYMQLTESWVSKLIWKHPRYEISSIKITACTGAKASYLIQLKNQEILEIVAYLQSGELKSHFYMQNYTQFDYKLSSSFIVYECERNIILLYVGSYKLGEVLYLIQNYLFKLTNIYCCRAIQS